MSTRIIPSSRTGAPRPAFRELLRTEARYAWRVPVGLLGGVSLPVVALVILGAIPGLDKPVKSLGGLTWFAVYFPILIVTALLALTLFALPLHLASYRQMGILRRLSTTPVPPGWMLAAQVAVNLVIAAVALGILTAAGTAGFGLGAPAEPGGFVLALVLSTAATFAIGLWISAIARTEGYASAIGNLLLYPLLFFAGMWMPREGMPSVLRHISDWTPSGAAVRALQDSMHGPFPAVQSLLVLAAWTAAFGVLAIRFFRWE